MEQSINIFLLPTGYHPSLDNQTVSGYGPPGDPGTNPAYLGMVLLYNVFFDFTQYPPGSGTYGGRPWVVNPLIAHELGHVFGLYHTNFYELSYKRFSPELPWPEEKYFCHPNTDPKCSNNMMSYSSSQRYLSPKQIGHIHRVFSSNTNRIRYLRSYAGNPAYNVVISSNTIWDMATVAQGDIIIMPGSTLEVTCVLSMLKDTRIIIKPGAKLIVDGGMITNPVGDTWQGIYVEGDRHKSQTFANQGALILKNGAIIENAINAVSMRSANYFFVYSGGIIQATDATFRNNRRNVRFFPYSRYDSNGQYINNISYFTRVTFETNNSAIHNSYLENVSMWGVKGVKFNNCVFKDNSPNRRDGILAHDASFIVNQSSFQNLKYSIYALSPNSNHTFSVSNSTFVCNRGIYMNLVDNATIINNTFNIITGRGNIPETDCTKSNYGIYIDYAIGYKIENNVFTGYNRPPLEIPVCGPIGIIARHTGSYTNELYRNDFSMLKVGIQAQGTNKGYDYNQGLFLHCNNLNKNYYDFHVKHIPRSRPSGIRELQGYGSTNASLAGNLFGHDASMLLSNFVVDSQSGNIAYFHHNPASEPRVRPLVYSTDKITLWSSDRVYSADISCPDEVMAVKPYEVVLLEKEEARLKYEETNLNLRELIDAGNSDDLKRSIDEAGPAVNMPLYNYLMGIAPFLSEEVLAKLAAKEKGFTNVMIRNVLVKSPQAPKLDMVVEKLNSRNIPLPPPMRKKIDEGLDYFGEKELLEQEMAYYKTTYDVAMNELLRNKIHEIEGWEDAPDVQDILATSDDIRYKYLLAEYYFENEDYEQGMQLLNNIETQHSALESSFAENHIDYISFYSLLQQVDIEESPGYTNLSAETLEALESFIESDSRIAGKAIAILIMNEAIEYNEPIYFPELKTEIKSETAYDFTEFNSLDFIEVDITQPVFLYPNPAKDNISINWCVEDEKSLNATIDIYNSIGTLIYSYSERNSCSNSNISVSGWRPGTYTAIFNYGIKSESINFIISK